MANREIEARLRLSATDRTGPAFKSVSGRLAAVERSAKNFNRTAGAMSRVSNAAMAASMRAIAPAAAALVGAKAFTQFAEIERRMSRIGIKLGATREEMQALQTTMGATAGKFALPMDELMATVDAFAESGGSLKEIREQMDGLAKAQQGLGAGGAEVVATWDAARKSLGLTNDQAEKFFDRIAAGGAAGKFEGGDLARYLPSLLPIASARGFKGLDGIERLVGALETMRDFTGTSEEAAASISDFMEKVASPDVERNFKKVNIDLPRALKKARADGVDLFTAMGRLLRDATGGDMDKLGYLFGDKEARRFAALLMQQMDALEKKIGVIRNKSDGMISDNVNRVLGDAQASVDKLNNSWGNFLTSLGSVIAKPAVPFLDANIKQVEEANALQAGRQKMLNSGRDPDDYFDQYLAQYVKDNPDQWFASYNANREYQKRLRAYGRGEIDNIFDPLPSELPVQSGGPTTRRSVRPKGGLPTTAPVPPKDWRTMTGDERLATGYAQHGNRTYAAGADIGDANWNEFQRAAAHAKEDLIAGGSEAGESIASSARMLQDAGGVFAKMLEGVGTKLGTDAGNAFNATAKPPRPTSGDRNLGSTAGGWGRPGGRI